GALTAGIAHEIRNPLNFVTNFAENASSLLQEVTTALRHPPAPGSEAGRDLEAALESLGRSVQLIRKHGQRADGIIGGMLQHARDGSDESELLDLNALVAESVNLAYHGMRAKDQQARAAVETVYDHAVGQVRAVRSDVSRVIINLMSNAFYATRQKQA